MISIDEARAIIRANYRSFGEEEIPFENSTERILAEPILADRDFPAFDRASMDGIVVRYEDWQNGTRKFQLIGEQLAGQKQMDLSEADTCREIMTGAIVSNGGDVVIRYEDLTISSSTVIVPDIEIKQWSNVHKQGTDAHKGDELIPAGKPINIGDIGILASVGKGKVKVKKTPRVAVISTGDELVGVDQTPLAYQLRSSNASVIGQLLKQVNIDHALFHFPDELESFRSELPSIITDFDVILLSGGVSKGKRDYVPEMMLEQGIRMHFHGVQQRPGKPIWFGSNDEVIVFGFPGNPVSTLACYQVYFKTWLAGSLNQEIPKKKARLTTYIHFKPDLTYFVPVRLMHEGNELMASPLLGHGSGDLVNLSNADGFIELPRGREEYKATDIYPIIEF